MMDTRELRDYAIVKTAKKIDGIGKAGMMMVMYLLQHVYKTPLNYKFSLYTYGPYDEAVFNCIDSAERNKLIKLEQHVGSNNSYGYHIHAICEDKVVDVTLIIRLMMLQKSLTDVELVIGNLLQ